MSIDPECREYYASSKEIELTDEMGIDDLIERIKKLNLNIAEGQRMAQILIKHIDDNEVRWKSLIVKIENDKKIYKNSYWRGILTGILLGAIFIIIKG